jgi:tetratricopeptide (TPR) repeat protein
LTFSQSNNDSLLRELDKTLERKEEFVQAKIHRIENHKASLKRLSEPEKFDVYFKIYDEYKTFIYDSAFLYAKLLQNAAYHRKDPVSIDVAKLKLGFVLLSSGMFNEALDSLTTINASGLPDSSRIEYYFVMARTYYDLIDFNKDEYYAERYRQRGNVYIDSAIQIAPRGTIQYKLLEALQDVKTLQWDSARINFENIISQHRLTDPQTGVAASTLGYIYLRSGDEEKAIHYMTRAAMADIRSCTKETLAILNLAEILYENGEVKKAYFYVKQAMEDANFYGARHRKIQVASIFPLIEGDELNTVEKQRKMLFLYSIAVTLLSVVIIIFAVIIFKQFKKLQAAEATITAANNSLQDANHKLSEVNVKLMEANKIKEEYIGYYFNINTEYLEKIEAFRRSIDNKLMAKKFDEIKYVVSGINIKKEREELYFSFDKVFVKLFPDFVNTFNSFFSAEDKIVLKDGQLLNTELRIFALIRMGIHDAEKIAKILDYSVNTIYSYKARIKSKSLIPNEEFEKRIMDIRAI